MSDFSHIPALKGFFECKETTGTVLHCACSNLEWDVSLGGHSLVFDEATQGIGSTMDSDSVPVKFAEGTVCPLISTNKDYLWFCSGRLTGTDYFRVSTGDVNELLPEYAGIGTGHAMSDGPFHGLIGPNGANIHVKETGNANLFSLAAVKPLDVIIAHRYSGINNTLLYEAYDAQSGSLLMEALTYTSQPAIDDIQSNPCFRFSGILLYGVQLWEFSSFPSEIVDAFLWMGKRWALGRDYRDIYPAWSGIKMYGLGML